MRLRNLVYKASTLRLRSRDLQSRRDLGQIYTGNLRCPQFKTNHTPLPQHQGRSLLLHANYHAAKMTRAQQTISIGLLVTSVRKAPFLEAIASTLFNSARANRNTVLSRSLPSAHPTSKSRFRRDTTSCTFTAAPKFNFTVPSSVNVSKSPTYFNAATLANLATTLSSLLICLLSCHSGHSSPSEPTSYSNSDTAYSHSTMYQRHTQSS